MSKYIALFESTGNGKGYSVVFPDFPGLFSAGDDYDDALRMAHEALALHVAAMEHDGENIPKPRTLEEIKQTWEDWQEWEDNYNFVIGYVSLIPTHGVLRRVNVTLSEELLQRIDDVSRNRSSFLENAARKLLFDNKPGNNEELLEA